MIYDTNAVIFLQYLQLLKMLINIVKIVDKITQNMIFVID